MTSNFLGIISSESGSAKFTNSLFSTSRLSAVLRLHISYTRDQRQGDPTNRVTAQNSRLGVDASTPDFEVDSELLMWSHTFRMKVKMEGENWKECRALYLEKFCAPTFPMVVHLIPRGKGA